MLPSGLAVRAQPSRKLIFQTKNIANSRKGVNACKETEKNPTFRFQIKKCIALRLFEFQEQYVVGSFLIKITQFEKIGLLGKVLIPLRKSKNYIPFSITFFRAISAFIIAANFA